MVDLLDGRAVHAIAGHRDRYQPVAFCDGDPARLIQHYQSVGTRGIYLADLDALEGGRVQWELLSKLSEATDDELLLDFGWRGRHHSLDAPDRLQNRLNSFAGRATNVRFIAATESMLGLAEVKSLADIVEPSRTLLGLDFRAGELIHSQGANGVNLGAWLKQAVQIKCHGVVVLDVADVGTSRGPTTLGVCRTISERSAGLRIISGGGVRDEDDLRQLKEAGCDGILLATALLPGIET